MSRVPPSTPIRRREVAGWCLYDFADSGFTTVIVTAFYVLYFKEVVVGDPGRGDLYWGLANGLSELSVAILAPVLGAIADASANKLFFLRCCAVLIVIFTASLFFVGPGMVVAGMALFILANIGFSGGYIFIDAFLPELSHRGNVGRLSGYRWGLGYLGGMLCLATIVPLAAGGFGADNLWRARAVFPVVALWYLLWSMPTFVFLRERAVPDRLASGQTYWTAGFSRLAQTFRQVRRYRELFKFLLAYWIYNDAVVTIIVFAAAYANDTLGFTVSENILLILSVNAPAALGSVGFGRLVDRIGAKRTVMLTLILWLVVIAATLATTSKAPFYAVAALAGIAMGASQSSSRSLMAGLTPPGRSAEFFGFLGVAGKVSAMIGPVMFGLLSASTGSQRTGVVAVGGLFAIGMLVLSTVDEQAGQAAARQTGEARP